MTETKATTEPFVQHVGTDWVPVVLRGLVALLLAPAAVLKFVDYSGQAALFAEYGIPAPETTVLLIGAIQLPLAILIALGIAGRLGALLVIPIMVTAMLTAGVEATNVVVLLGCIGIVLLGTGNYSLWEPEDELVNRR
ncbi:DoxX family protein [Natrarchaeobius sp. A-rgal3]|uniref:DoxX family protein n=1 Tax=Natrarchaeobius versutus TaxID=1679078 RepID=UPI0035100F66